jgi:hypothetical protein
VGKILHLKMGEKGADWFNEICNSLFLGFVLGTRYGRPQEEGSSGRGNLRGESGAHTVVWRNPGLYMICL